MLEQRLQEIDQHEASPLFLGKSRSDGNADRISLLAAIETCLADYGTIYKADMDGVSALMDNRSVR